MVTIVFADGVRVIVSGPQIFLDACRELNYDTKYITQVPISNTIETNTIQMRLPTSTEEETEWLLNFDFVNDPKLKNIIGQLRQGYRIPNNLLGNAIPTSFSHDISYNVEFKGLGKCNVQVPNYYTYPQISIAAASSMTKDPILFWTAVLMVPSCTNQTEYVATEQTGHTLLNWLHELSHLNTSIDIKRVIKEFDSLTTVSSILNINLVVEGIELSKPLLQYVTYGDIAVELASKSDNYMLQLFRPIQGHRATDYIDYYCYSTISFSDDSDGVELFRWIAGIDEYLDKKSSFRAYADSITRYSYYLNVYRLLEKVVNSVRVSK